MRPFTDIEITEVNDDTEDGTSPWSFFFPRSGFYHFFFFLSLSFFLLLFEQNFVSFRFEDAWHRQRVLMRATRFSTPGELLLLMVGIVLEIWTIARARLSRGVLFFNEFAVDLLQVLLSKLRLGFECLSWETRENFRLSLNSNSELLVIASL